MRIGYARVSSQDQNLCSQLDQLSFCDQVWKEKQSGKDAKRPELQKMLAKLRPGDVVVVTKLDRLARSVRDLLGILEKIEGEGAKFQSLGEPWANTDTPMGRFLVTLLAGVAEFERSLILSRCNEGRESARRRGVALGRPFSLNGREGLAMERLQGGDPPSVVAKMFGVSVTTIKRLRQRHCSQS